MQDGRMHPTGPEKYITAWMLTAVWPMPEAW